jgi:hypothetical protein
MIECDRQLDEASADPDEQPLKTAIKYADSFYYVSQSVDNAKRLLADVQQAKMLLSQAMKAPSLIRCEDAMAAAEDCNYTRDPVPQVSGRCVFCLCLLFFVRFRCLLVQTQWRRRRTATTRAIPYRR